MQTFFISFFLVFVNTLGQILLKKSTLVEGGKVIYITLGYLLFFMAIIFSFYLMKTVELKYFTVIMSSIYLTVLLASAIVFKEKIDKNKIIGTIIVFVGMLIFVGG